jgi:hypothetical protein
MILNEIVNDKLTFCLNEKSVAGTSVIDVGIPFFAVDNVDSMGFDLLTDKDGLLFGFVSLIEG